MQSRMRLINADALYKIIDQEADFYGGFGDNMITASELRRCIEMVPTIDAVPVVRCRECRYYEIVQLRKDGEDDRRYKPSVCVRGKYAEYRKPEWYCADGKRKEGAK